MVKTELVKRSPLRILENSTHGGVGVGNVGVIASDRGVGKTACLVHIATDNLFQGKHVIHLSFSTRVDHIIQWYESIFTEISKKRGLEEATAIHDQLITNRVIMNFSQKGMKAESVLKAIEALISEGQFDAEVIVIDGYDFENGDVSTLHVVKDFAKKHGIAVWATADIEDEVDERGVPAALGPYVDDISVLIDLQPKDDHIQLALIKDHDHFVDEDLHLKLESTTLLIAEDS